VGRKDSKHYCFDQISWRARPDIAPNTAEFTMLSAFRQDFFQGSGKDGLPVQGDIIFDTMGGASLTFGDGNFSDIQMYIVTDISEKENWILGRALDPLTGNKTILHTYPAPADPETGGSWKAGIKSAHRQAVEEHVNNPDGGYQLETLVEFKTLSGSPAPFVDVIVNATHNSVFSFSVTCRLATDLEASSFAGGFTQPGPPYVANPLTVDDNTVMVSWDTTSTNPGQPFYQVVVEDGKSESCVEVFIQVNEKAGEPPVCGVPDEIQSAYIGTLFSINIVASDPDGWITGIEAVNLPPWATLSIITNLPTADAVASISGIAGPEDTGLYVLSIVATDNDGNQAVSPLKIRVDDGFEDIHPEEKKNVGQSLKIKVADKSYGL